VVEEKMISSGYFSTGWRQEGHPASKSLHQLSRQMYTFPPLIRLPSPPSVILSEKDVVGCMERERVKGETGSGNPGSPGRMTGNPDYGRHLEFQKVIIQSWI